jgi:hypothetical protein
MKRKLRILTKLLKLDFLFAKIKLQRKIIPQIPYFFCVIFTFSDAYPLSTLSQLIKNNFDYKNTYTFLTLQYCLCVV